MGETQQQYGVRYEETPSRINEDSFEEKLKYNLQLNQMISNDGADEDEGKQIYENYLNKISSSSVENTETSNEPHEVYTNPNVYNYITSENGTGKSDQIVVQSEPKDQGLIQVLSEQAQREQDSPCDYEYDQVTTEEGDYDEEMDEL